MSFFDNTKILGWTLFAVGIISIVAGLLSAVTALTLDGGLNKNLGLAIVGIGLLIAGVIYFKYGNSVRTGKIAGKMPILTQFVHMVGYSTFISSVFGIVGYLIAADTTLAGSNVFALVLALIILWAAKKMGDGSVTTADRVIWLLMVVIFVIEILLHLVAILSFQPIDVIIAILGVIIYLFMLTYLLDSDVKKQMGM